MFVLCLFVLINFQLGATPPVPFKKEKEKEKETTLIWWVSSQSSDGNEIK